MAALAVAALSCSEDFASEENNIESEGRTLSVIASVDDEQTRVTAPSTDGYEWSFEWETDDTLLIPEGMMGTYLTIDADNFDKYNATFTGIVPKEGESYLYSGYNYERYLVSYLTSQDGTLNQIPLKSSEPIDFATVTDGIQPVKMEHTAAFVKLNTTFDTDMSGYTLKTIGIMNMNSYYKYMDMGYDMIDESYETENITITPSTPIEATDTQSVPFCVFPTTISSGGSINILLILEDEQGNEEYAAFTKSPADGASYIFERATVNNINISCSTADLVEFEGEGTDSDPYQISTAKELNEFSVLTNFNIGQSYYYKQTADIDLEDALFTPIYYFAGTYNGAGHIIKGLNVQATSDSQGLFGYATYGTTIINLGVEGSVYTTGYYAGGIVGYAFYTNIINCYNRCSVEGKSDVGGIAGMFNKSNIINCYNAGTIAGSSKGGLVGNLFYSTLQNSYYINNESSSYGTKSSSTESNVAKKSQTEMQDAAFVTLMNKGVESYNADNTDGVQAIAWKAVVGDYPTFDIQ